MIRPLSFHYPVPGSRIAAGKADRRSCAKTAWGEGGWEGRGSGPSGIPYDSSYFDSLRPHLCQTFGFMSAKADKHGEQWNLPSPHILPRETVSGSWLPAPVSVFLASSLKLPPFPPFSPAFCPFRTLTFHHFLIRLPYLCCRLFSQAPKTPSFPPKKRPVLKCRLRFHLEWAQK